MFDFLMSESERKIRDETRQFVKTVPRQLIRDMDADKVRYPADYVRNLAERRLIGIRFSEKYGGRGLDWAHEVAALEEVGVFCSSLACLYSLPSIIGEALHVFGTEEQKERYLRPIIEGRLFCAEALTEPRGGSDFFGATTTAIKDGDDYVLNGQKRFIVGAEGADVFLVYVRTNLDKNVPGHHALSVFIVEREMGVKVENVYGLMGSRGGGTGRIRFENTRVPAGNLIYRENGGGEVFNRMMIPERLTSAAGAIGAARAALEVATRYSNKRTAFGKKIRTFQAVSFLIAESVATLDAARALVWATAKKVDSGEDARRMVSEAKKVATESAWKILNSAMQVMGGIGYTNVYPIERLLRDMRLSMIWTGTNEIMNLLVQHEWYKEVLEAADMGRDVELDAVGAEQPDEKIYE